MPNYEAPTQGTMVIAALLVLTLMYAGYWIVSVVNDANPWASLPWFGVAVAVIIVLGFFTFWRRGDGEGGG